MQETGSISLLLDELWNQWEHLLGKLVSSELDIDEETLTKMDVIHKKLALTRLMQERYILAITGLQGAGKTTILKRLYELDDEFLPENLGRGEQIPVLITESNVTKPEGEVLRAVRNNVTNEMELIHTKVDGATFKKIAKDPSDEDQWLELKVPKRYFNDSKKSLALLPGFESNQKERSQRFLRHILYLSTSSVVVFRKDTYARKSNEKLFQQVQEIYKDVKPIFVLSHGDINPEQNGQMREQMLQDFRIDPNEADRIVVSGDSKEFGDSWKEELMTSVMNYGYVTGAGQNKQLDMMKEIFGEIRKLIIELDKVVKKKENALLSGVNDRYEGLNTHQLTYQFVEFYEKLLEKLERDLKENLQGRTKDAQRHFEDYIKKNHNFWNRLTSRFTVKALEEQRKLEDAIEEAWREASKELPEKQVAKVVTNYIRQESHLLNEPIEEETPAVVTSEIPIIEELSGSDTVEGMEELVLESVDTHPAVVAVTETSLQRIDRYFNPETRNELVPLYRKDLKALTLMGTLLSRQALIAQPLLQKVNDESKNLQSVSWGLPEYIKGKPLEQTIQNVETFSEQLEKMSGISNKVLKSIPLLLGVDVLMDGEADLITIATTALAKIGIVITPLQLIGILGAGFGVVYAANAVQKGVHETNKQQLQLAQAGRQVINQLPELQTKAYIYSLRRIFERMADHLAEVHRERIGVFAQDGKIQKLQYTIGRIKNINGELQRMVIERGSYT